MQRQGVATAGGMKVEVRTAKEEETAQVQYLWEYCFFEEATYLRWVFGEHYAAENTVVAAEHGTVVGALQLVPCALRVKGTIQQCYYIAGVSVLPQYRGKGTAHVMMEFAEQVAARRGISLLLLVPSVDGYYERFGYVNCAAKEEYVFPVSRAADYRFAGETRGDAPPEALLRLYETYSACWEVSALRGEEEFRQIMQCFQNTHGGTVAFYLHGEAVAYLMYQITPEEITVPECAYVREEGAEAILQFIGSHAMQTKRVVLRTAPGDPLYTKLYQTDVRRVLTPSFMAKKVGGTTAETVRCLGVGAGKQAKLMGQTAGRRNDIYINLPQWY